MISYKQNWLLLKRRIRSHIVTYSLWEWMKDDKEWTKLLIKKKKKRKILISTMTGSNWSCTIFDSLIGAGLNLNDCDVYYLLCDKILPACQECTIDLISESELINGGPQKSLCKSCYKPAKNLFERQGIKVLNLSDFVQPSANPALYDDEEINHSNYKSGQLRYYGISSNCGERYFDQIEYIYKDAYEKSYLAFENLLDKYKFDTLIAHHGIYVPQSSAVEVFKKYKKHIITWCPGYKKGTFLFSVGDSYHFTIPNEKFPRSALQYTKDELESTRLALIDKKEGKNDWINFYNYNKKDQKLDINKRKYKKIFGLFTNVLWDAQLHFKSQCFKNQLEWIFFTIDEFINNSDNALIIRIHPAEITGTVKSRQKISNEIFSRYKTLPENIYIIDAESSISSYEVATIIDYSLVYGTKFAIELAVQGIPVLVSGDCWAKGKGFTIDITRKSQLKKFIENPNTIKFNKLKQTDRALRFARYLYFDRMIEIEDVILAKYFTQHKIMFKSFHQLRESKQLQNLINQILSRKKKITN